MRTPSLFTSLQLLQVDLPREATVYRRGVPGVAEAGAETEAEKEDPAAGSKTDMSEKVGFKSHTWLTHWPDCAIPLRPLLALTYRILSPPDFPYRPCILMFDSLGGTR